MAADIPPHIQPKPSVAEKTPTTTPAEVPEATDTPPTAVLKPVILHETSGQAAMADGMPQKPTAMRQEPTAAINNDQGPMPSTDTTQGPTATKDTLIQSAVGTTISPP